MSSKERRFVHPDPQKGEGKHPLEKKILHGKELITSDDIAAYVKDLVIELKRKSHKSRREAYIIQALSDDVLARRFFEQRRSLPLRILSVISENARRSLRDVPELQMPCEDATLIQAEIARVRKAVEERLKKELTQNPEFYDIRYSDVFIEQGAPFISASVRAMKDLNGKAFVFKKERSLRLEGMYARSEEALRQDMLHEYAFRRLLQLPQNDHLLIPSKGDPDAFEVLTERIEFEDEGPESRYARTRPHDLREDLSIIRDCINGAIFLAANELVLQDICPHNIGSYIKEGKRIGVLFDFEGIYPLDGYFISRLSHRGYEPPEISSSEPTRVRVSEMVYQFGMTLGKITQYWTSHQDIPQEVHEGLSQLFSAMTSYDARRKDPIVGRISLNSSLEHLDNIIETLSVSESPPGAVSS